MPTLLWSLCITSETPASERQTLTACQTRESLPASPHEFCNGVSQLPRPHFYQPATATA